MEVRDPLDLVRALLIVRYRACFLEGEKVLGDFPGLCKILYETTHPGIVHTCLFPYFCRYRFVLAVLHVEDGSYWSTMVSDCSLLGGRDLILHNGSARIFNVGLPDVCDSFNVSRPWVTVTRKESDLLSRPLVSALKL